MGTHSTSRESRRGLDVCVSCAVTWAGTRCTTTSLHPLVPIYILRKDVDVAIGQRRGCNHRPCAQHYILPLRHTSLVRAIIGIILFGSNLVKLQKKIKRKFSTSLASIEQIKPVTLTILKKISFVFFFSNKEYIGWLVVLKKKHEIASTNLCKRSIRLTTGKDMNWRYRVFSLTN